MSIQYAVPGFELTTMEYESPPITTRPGLPPCIIIIANKKDRPQLVL